MSAPIVSRRRVLAATLVLGAVRPAHALMAGDPPDAPERRIDPNVATSPWSGVASVVIGGGVYSAVLVGPRHVLTAGHVAQGIAAPDLHLHLNTTPGAAPLAVARVDVHPFHRSATPSANEVDLALLTLASDAPDVARRYAVETASHPIGEPLVLVGYGASGFGATGVSTPAHATVKRVGTNRISNIVAGGVRAAPWIYLFRFDPPGQGDATPGETGLAGGDSGSPAFVRVGRVLRVYGINTFVVTPKSARTSGFGCEGGGQVLAPHVAWLASLGVPIGA